MDDRRIRSPLSAADIRLVLAEDLSVAMKESILALSDEDVAGVAWGSEAEASGWGQEWAYNYGGIEFINYIKDRMQNP